METYKNINSEVRNNIKTFQTNILYYWIWTCPTYAHNSSISAPNRNYNDGWRCSPTAKIIITKIIIIIIIFIKIIIFIILHIFDNLEHFWNYNLQTFFRSMYGIARSMYGIARSMYGIPRSMYGIPRSMHGIQRSMYGIPKSMYGMFFLSCFPNEN